MKGRHVFLAALACALFSLTSLAQSADPHAEGGAMGLGLIELWASGTPAFGQFVTQEPEPGDAGSDEPVHFTVQTGRELAANTLLDYAFLSLEHHYDAESARNIAEGLRSGEPNSDMTLLVRIPPISVDGVDAARARVREVLALGANGVVIPHVLSAEEARVAISFFEDVNVWSPANLDGDVIAMLIVEDPPVFAELEEIGNMSGYSSLLCGIGSLTSALDGDREAAEMINQKVLAQSKRLGMPNLTTVDPESVALRVKQGFLALLAYGPESDKSIRLGRIAASR
jgi:hypothetical protein